MVPPSTGTLLMATFLHEYQFPKLFGTGRALLQIVATQILRQPINRQVRFETQCEPQHSFVEAKSIFINLKASHMVRS